MQSANEGNETIMNKADDGMRYAGQAHEKSDSMADKVHSAADRMTERANALAQSTDQATTRMMQLVRERPWTAIGLAFVGGMALSRIMNRQHAY